jgi:molecular chaperone DnaK
MQRLREAAEEAKIELSELKETHVLVEAITMTDKGPLTLDYTMTRDEFDAMTKDFIDSTVEPMQKALDSAGLTAAGIDTILLVGGSTRIPSVQRKMREFIGKNPSRDISPEEVVARGAAVQTMVLMPLEGDVEGNLATRYGNMPKGPVIIHMTPFALGVGLQNDQFGPIIEKNSTYPTEGKDIFTTTKDFQEAISFPIYEGESGVASENIFLDLLRIEGITPAPKGVPRIEVTFRLNPDRILEVTAEDLATGVQKRVVVSATAERLSNDEKNRMVKEARDRVAKMTLTKLSDSRSEEARHLLERAEATLSAAGNHNLATDLRFRTDELREAIESGNFGSLEESQDELLRLLAEIEAGA